MATISENLQTLLDIKSDIKTAIINKGVSVADSDGFNTYASKISSIPLTVEGYDFTVIGYTTENITINNTIEDDIAYSKTLYDAWDPSNTYARLKYDADSKLVYAPKINTSNVTDMYRMFSNCSSLIYVPLLDSYRVKNMYGMFANCTSLTKMPQLNTRIVENMETLFYNCKSLTSIPKLKAEYVSEIDNMFYKCSSLTDFGGLEDLGKSFDGSDYTLKLSDCPLTRESALNVLNGLYNMNYNTNYGINSGTAKVYFSTTTMALLTDADIAIGTNKDWVIA